MKVNTAESIRTANNVYSHYGSWEAVRQSSVLTDGKYVIQPKADDAAAHEAPKAAGRKVRKAG
ncbi:hypothetical protein [Asticcacaulis solisilvae]|uniref:hypothetical protein n=1 Tax=Asticcacaulis solisilvae TaxID=1217274 RepID=UPI003FD8C1F1